MSSNPLNLAVRFLMEIASLAALAYWGWSQHEGIAKILLAVGLPLGAAVIWGTFNVRDDPSRSGKAPIPVPGVIRLLIELIIFASGALALFASGLQTAGMIFTTILIIHYLISYDRIIWLLQQR